MSRQTYETVRYAALRCARLGVSKTFTWTVDTNRNRRGTRRVGVIIPPVYRDNGF
jgi:hypothetical protein